jgi:hypothetical protein
MLSELRKYRVGFTIAHQYLHQLALDIRHAVLGNAGTVTSFTYLKIMIDGSPSKPFSGVTLSPSTDLFSLLLVAERT